MTQLDTEDELRNLRIELSATYNLLDSYIEENERLRRHFKQTLDEVVVVCDNLLKEIKK